MGYNKNLRMQDLFNNPKLSSVIPQLGDKNAIKNTFSQSDADIENRVMEYLKSALNGSVTGQNDLEVNGTHKTVLKRVRELTGAMELFFGSMPTVTKNLRLNTRVYTPYVSIKQLEDIKTPQKKAEIMQIILDNIAYNPDFGSQAGVKNMQPLDYKKRQEAWMKKVGYKENQSRYRR